MDCVIASIPFTDTVAPLMAPAVLKAQCESNGFTAVALDLNAELRSQILASAADRSHFLRFYKQGQLHPDIAARVEQQIHFMSRRILAHSPRWVALSLFTYDCQWAARWLAWQIRTDSPTTQIVLGGAGLFENLTGDSHLGTELQSAGIIDNWIRGDGETTLLQILSGETDRAGMRTHTWQQHTNSELNRFPPPDYTDYHWDLYDQNFAVPILGSRGCVRDCTFCDIHVHWPRYTWRTGDSIFAEMLGIYEKHGYTRFRFQDSLINGNLREYRRLCELLAQHNQSRSDPMTWNSFFILRPQSQFGVADWELTHQSGGEHLMIGVESLNEISRYHLGKKFSNQDLEFGLNQIQRLNQIKPMRASLLFLIGYITENEQHIEEACQWWRDHAHYRSIIQVNAGTPLGILRNTPLHRRFAELGLRWIGPNDTDWANENSDPPTRARWYRKISATLRELNIKEVIGFDNHYILERIENGVFDENKHRI